MKNNQNIALVEYLWGRSARLTYLFVAAALLLFVALGTRELWTQEHRWADIVSGMFFRHDYFHPFLNQSDYYDKPLLSYWFIIAMAKLTGTLSTWAMRLPSALAGGLAIWAMYRIGLRLGDRRLGMLSAWLLLTTFYFIFWARTSSADMLNLAGILFAVCWYFEKKSAPSFINYTVFFLILAVTSLCKGLVGAVIPLLVILPDLFSSQEWKKHLHFKLLFATIPAMLVYLAPFLASAYWSGAQHSENGLYLVYRENILRYFHPFDHQGPLYTYFLYLPIYLLPWAIFFIPALWSLKSRWKTMSRSSRWMVWAVLLTFLFFTCSGSRRSYYVLPIVPFAILLTADWILAAGEWSKRYLWAGRITIIFLLALFLNFNVVQPLYYVQGGATNFAKELKQQAEQIRPWSSWQFVMLDARSKVRFYLQLSPFVKDLKAPGSQRQNQTAQNLLETWPVLKEKSRDTIFISRRVYAAQLQRLLPQYQFVDAPLTLGEKVLHKKDLNAPIAFYLPDKISSTVQPS